MASLESVVDSDCSAVVDHRAESTDQIPPLRCRYGRNDGWGGEPPSGLDGVTTTLRTSFGSEG